jgi:hypothetical protein
MLFVAVQVKYGYAISGKFEFVVGVAFGTQADAHTFTYPACCLCAPPGLTPVMASQRDGSNTHAIRLLQVIEQLVWYL